MAASLTVLGSSDAFNAGGRGHSCYLLEDALGAVAIDFGPTAMEAMKRLGREPLQLDGVLLTHLHGDHFGGLQTFLADAVYRSRRARPFTIAGPPGTGARIQALFALAYRSASQKGLPFPLTVVEYVPGDRLKILGRTVTVYPAEHQRPPEEIACVLRVESAADVLAFSGDTGWTEALLPASEGADLFVCECTFFDEPTPQHLAWTKLEPQLERLSARRILLSHLSEAMRDRAEAIRRAGRVEVAEDGMRLEV